MRHLDLWAEIKRIQQEPSNEEKSVEVKVEAGALDLKRVQRVVLRGKR